MTTFATRLRALRQAAGLSAYRLAQLSGLSKTALSKLESGQCAPKFSTACLLAKALAVPLTAFQAD